MIYSAREREQHIKKVRKEKFLGRLFINCYMIVGLPFVLGGEAREYIEDGGLPINPDLMHSVRSREDLRTTRWERQSKYMSYILTRIGMF